MLRKDIEKVTKNPRNYSLEARIPLTLLPCRWSVEISRDEANAVRSASAGVEIRVADAIFATDSSIFGRSERNLES